MNSSPGGRRISIIFDGSSAELRDSVVVATLDAPITDGKNTVWCASFVCCWKEAMDEFAAGEPLRFTKSSRLAAALNAAPDSRAHMDVDELYTEAGYVQKGILDTIRRTKAERFPGSEVPQFPGIALDSFVAYAYLQVEMDFTLAYMQSEEPMVFTDSAGRESPVSSFGLREQDRHKGYDKLRAQAGVLFHGDYRNNSEYAIDLHVDSSPNQIVIARVDRQPTLAATVARARRLAREFEHPRSLGSGEVLLVPDIYWRIDHSFSELLGLVFANEGMVGDQCIGVAKQKTSFRLSRGGVQLESEAALYKSASALNFVFDGPHLIYIQKRDAERPFFAMWVDNAELLCPWDQAP